MCTGDRILERIPLPVVNTPLLFPPYQGGTKGGVRQSPAEAPKAFGTENERRYFVSGGMPKTLQIIRVKAFSIKVWDNLLCNLLTM
jgi:hypothetical protein